MTANVPWGERTTGLVSTTDDYLYLVSAGSTLVDPKLGISANYLGNDVRLVNTYHYNKYMLPVLESAHRMYPFCFELNICVDLDEVSHSSSSRFLLRTGNTRLLIDILPFVLSVHNMMPLSV